MGGFTYWWTAGVTAHPNAQSGAAHATINVSSGPLPTLVTMNFQMHMSDRYNWDKGKSVTIFGITVDDH